MLFKDIPCVKDQTYFIMVGINGSWLWNACYPNVMDTEWCTNFVKTFIDDYGCEVNYTHSDGTTSVCDNNLLIQQHIDDSYEEIMEFKLRKVMDNLIE